MTQQKTLMPFSEGAKYRDVPDKILSDKLTGFSSGATSTMAMRKVGFTMGLLVHLEMTATLGAGTPVLNEEGLYALIQRIQVVIGNNQAQPIDLNGAALHSIQRELGFNNFGGFDSPSTGKVVANSKFYSAPIVAASANVWKMTFYVPFSANFHTDRHLGALPTAARSFTANLQIDWAKDTDVVTGVTIAVTNSKATVESLVLDVPDFNAVDKPKFWIFARRSQTVGNVIAGDNKLEVPQGGILLHLGGIVKANGIRTDAVNEVGYVMAGNDQPRTQTLKFNQANYKARHNIDLPTGEFVYNLLEGYNEGFSGSYRDTIDTTKTGLLELLVNVDATADLSTNPAKNSITMIRTMQHPINVVI